MLIKPYVYDDAYSGMDAPKAFAQYQRDLAQYEQAIALQKLAEKNSTSSDNTFYLVTVTDIIDKDAPEYEEALSVEKERDNLYAQFKRLCNTYQLLQVAIYIPLSFILFTIAINLPLTIFLGIIVLISVISIPSVKSEANRIEKKIYELHDKLFSIADKYLDRKKYLKKYTRKKSHKKGKMYIKRKLYKKPSVFLDLTK